MIRRFAGTNQPGGRCRSPERLLLNGLPSSFTARSNSRPQLWGEVQWRDQTARCAGQTCGPNLPLTLVCHSLLDERQVNNVSLRPQLAVVGHGREVEGSTAR